VVSAGSSRTGFNEVCVSSPGRQTIDALCRFPGRVFLQGAFSQSRKRRNIMAKKKSTKAHLSVHAMPTGKQWAHKGKGGKKKTKVLAKLTSHK
jgi:hypothetical protein